MKYRTQAVSTVEELSSKVIEIVNGARGTAALESDFRLP